MVARVSISNQIASIQAHIQKLAQAVGRNPDDIQLIAVSKTQNLSTIQKAIEAGHHVFGENKMQEAIEKIDALPKNLEWHFIGHLQKNKAKFSPHRFQWIHSIDSIALIHQLQKRYQAAGLTLNALIQVNVSKETTKQGVESWPELCKMTEALLECDAIALRGLMTISDPSFNEEETKNVFATVREWKNQLQQTYSLSQCTELSMGMSSDYPLAIAEGATFIRIGTSIFGARDYAK